MSNPINFTQSTTVREIQGGLLLNKPTIGQKFGDFFKKFGSIFAGIGSAVMRFLPGGSIASPALYGVSQLLGRSYQNTLAKRHENIALHEAALNSPGLNALIPGFNSFTQPGAPTAAPQNSIQIMDTVVSRDLAYREATMDKFLVG